MARKSTAKRATKVTSSAYTPILTPAVLDQAIQDTQGMSVTEKLLLADELYLHQPNLLGFVLVLNTNFGASFEQIEPLIETMIVTWQAMKIRDRKSTRLNSSH